MPITTIYDRVIEAHKRAGLPHTQRAIGKSLGRSQGAIGNWKQGVAKPSIDHAITMATNTGVCVEWLLTGRGPMAPGAAPTIQESELLQLFQRLPDTDQASVLEFARFTADRIAKGRPASAGAILASDMEGWRK